MSRDWTGVEISFVLPVIPCTVALYLGTYLSPNGHVNLRRAMASSADWDHRLLHVSFHVRYEVFHYHRYIVDFRYVAR